MEEKIIGFAVVMFVLSQISERITNFIKLYWLKEDNLTLFQESVEKSPEHRRKVFYLSLLGGVITTLLFCITFFWTTKYDPDSAINWLRKYLASDNEIQLVASFISVAIFLSFGSKFWHDFLDIVFFYKNMKRKLSDPLLYEQESTAQIELYLEGTSQELAKVALDKLLPNFEKLDGFVGISTVYASDKGEHELLVRFERKQHFEQLKPVHYYRDEAGMKRRINVKYLANGKVRAHCGLGSALSVKNGDFTAAGRCCYFFKSSELNNGKLYGLTCAHVFGETGEVYLEGLFDISLGNGSDALSMNVAAEYADDSDAVKFVLDDPLVRDLNLTHIPSIVGSTSLDNEVVTEGVKIATQQGVVAAEICPEKHQRITVEYADKSTRTFRGLLTIRRATQDANGGENTSSPTTAGDSGGLVYLDNQQAVGMIIAGDSQYSYAISIPVLERSLNIRICPIAELRQMQSPLVT